MARSMLVQASFGLWLAVAAGLPGLQVGMDWVASGGHHCVCPLDAQGHCACPICARLGVHDGHRRLSSFWRGPVVSSCQREPGGAMVPPTLPPAVVPSVELGLCPGMRRVAAPSVRARVPVEPLLALPERPS